jgi:AraC-like DNA-binding protein
LTLLAGMNRTKLMSGFKDLFGTTIYSYVADLRMERAKELLIREPLLKIADIARRVGFKNPNNFSAAFKKKFGYSPNTLR